jgi:hypothetical protein
MSAESAQFFSFFERYYELEAEKNRALDQANTIVDALSDAELRAELELDKENFGKVAKRVESGKREFIDVRDQQFLTVNFARQFRGRQARFEAVGLPGLERPIQLVGKGLNETSGDGMLNALRTSLTRRTVPLFNRAGIPLLGRRLTHTHDVIVGAFESEKFVPAVEIEFLD